MYDISEDIMKSWTECVTNKETNKKQAVKSILKV